ncbi:MAG: lipoyl synthase [Planctomycetes bacterium]|nr:lipoyl synthase [Planctomycetota bacterium]
MAENRLPRRSGFPPWLRQKIPSCGAFEKTRGILEGLGLDTVCRGARCPNRAQCFARGTATFLLLGPSCTRRCGFCSIDHGPPSPPDPTEPRRVAQAVKRMGLAHAVTTSVTRDDLPDGGASHFAAVVRAVREEAPGVTVEVLTPDFRGDAGAVRTVAAAGPDVYNHNVETVPSLYSRVRPQADYRRSLGVLETAKGAAPDRLVKSGLMLGLGEAETEVESVLRDLRSAGCDLLTIGQYLKPAKDCLEVERYVTPEEFDGWALRAREMGFREVASAPFVRSSYRAAEMAKQA